MTSPVLVLRAWTPAGVTIAEKSTSLEIESPDVVIEPPSSAVGRT